ncbi:MAG: prepilin-type N-terminal cleavage/methylation domain-containing protein [Deltaproteobacteria bacterium]|nr:MAG: prepilin-type N-terminal cleavage/methylation domain-containing protein [Deltaproteobacteria bacterium]
MGSSILKSNATGFTLIEIIAVLVILSTIAALAIPKFIDLDENAKGRAIEAGISELNGRESLIWADIKVSPTGWQDDATLFATMDTDLGTANYVWIVGPTAAGGRLSFQSGSPVDLIRTPSTSIGPAKWSRM